MGIIFGIFTHFFFFFVRVVVVYIIIIFWHLLLLEKSSSDDENDSLTCTLSTLASNDIKADKNALVEIKHSQNVCIGST